MSIAFMIWSSALQFIGKYYLLSSVGMSAVWELCASATPADIVHLVLGHARIISQGKNAKNQENT